jgi:hypothetical protein
MRRLTFLLVIALAVTACGLVGTPGGDTTTTMGSEDPGDGDEPIAEPGEPGVIPEPRPPIPGNVDGPVMISSASLRIMESFPIQVALDVEGDKPTPCHEIFWTVDDTGETIEIEMISQTASDQACAQVIEPFIIAVPLGSWQGESRDVTLNGEPVGSFDS